MSLSPFSCKSNTGWHAYLLVIMSAWFVRTVSMLTSSQACHPRKLNNRTGYRCHYQLSIALEVVCVSPMNAAGDRNPYLGSGITRSFESRGCRTHAMTRVFTLPGFFV